MIGRENWTFHPTKHFHFLPFLKIKFAVIKSFKNCMQHIKHTWYMSQGWEKCFCNLFWLIFGPISSVFPNLLFCHFSNFAKKSQITFFGQLAGVQKLFLPKIIFFHIFVVTLYTLVNSLKWPQHHFMGVQRWTLSHFRV